MFAVEGIDCKNVDTRTGLEAPDATVVPPELKQGGLYYLCDLNGTDSLPFPTPSVPGELSLEGKKLTL